MQDLTQEQWTSQFESEERAVLIDVRSDIELEDGIIPNAIHMDIQNPGAFLEKAQTLDKEAPCYVYCRSGSRSSQACMILESLGFNTTYNLLGGFSEWEGEKLI